ncbi:MAG: GAF domain-containing protein [Anaerolineae bacterium]|nr:GAF domain-containing protein [Anaerolineae bacterium]
MLTSFDRDRVLKNVIDFLMRSFDVEQASLLMLSGVGEADGWQLFSLRPRFQTAILRMPMSEEALQQAHRIVNDGLARWVIQQKQGTIIEDTHTDARWLEIPDIPSGVRSVLCVPFVLDDQVIGVFTLQHPEAAHFSELDLQIMTIVANQVSVAMRNAELFTQMQAQQKQLEEVLRAMPDVLFVLDADGKLLMINESGVELLGGRDEFALLGKNVRDLQKDDSALSLVVEIIDSPLQSGQRWSFEAHSDQHKRDFVVNVSVWEQEPGGKAGYVIVMRDITQMRDLNRFKDEMLQMASHDLRSPLALIVGYCSLMQMDVDPDSKIAEYLGIVQQQTERMTGLLDDLLRVEKIRTSPLELYERVDFQDVVNSALNSIRASVDAKQQRLSADLRLDHAPTILLSPPLIREAMANLLSNAVKYTPEKGRIKVTAYMADQRVYFVVEDTGIGIPPENLPRLFTSFYRVRQPGSEDVEGRGLGLSLVKTIVERHTGEVWAESTMGVGSRFGFWLPL